MNDDNFRDIAREHLLREVYEKLRREGAEAE